MSEIGSGSGSSYPGTLDANVTIEVDAPNAGKTKAKAAIVNDLAADIIAIETTLGVNPQGSKTTVVARIDQEHNADGSHKDSLVVTVSGHNQNITGRKVFAAGISLDVDGLFGTATGHTVGKTVVGASGAMWFQDDVRTSGSIHLARNPVVGLEAASKQYVDNAVATATIADSNVTIDTVSGYIGGITTYIDSDGSHAGPFDIDANISSAWESIGPTGAGATNTWTVLDSVPSNAKAVILKISRITVATGQVGLYARVTGSSGAVDDTTIIFESSGVATVSFVFVPIDSNRRFDLYFDWYTGIHVNMYLVGWLE